MTAGKFWIQGNREFKKIFTLKTGYCFSRKQYQNSLLHVPRDLKHVKFQSLKIIFDESPEPFQNPYYDLVFCAHILIRVNDKSAFKVSNEAWIKLKIQKWAENCLNRYDRATLLMIILIDNQGFEEIFDVDEERDDWSQVHWIRF
jgi:hypothetical protein